MEENLTVRFKIEKKRRLFSQTVNGRVVLEGIYADSVFCVKFLYTYSDEYLSLQSYAKAGDEVMIKYRPYRIELYVNGNIKDEEWQCGKRLFDFEKATGIHLELSPLEEESRKPVITDTVSDIASWRPGEGVFIGDCMPYSDGERFHLHFLKDRHHHSSKWGKGAHQWGHISSTDLIHWDVHPLAAEIDDPYEGSITTGSHIFCGGTHYIYYAVRTVDGSPAHIKRSVSHDGIYYEKDRNFSLIISDRYRNTGARDPKVFSGEDGRLHMLVTTTDKKLNMPCLAHLISEDGELFSEVGNLYTAESTNSEPECPDYFKFGDYYYLICSHFGAGQYRYSEKPFSDFRVSDDVEIRCGWVPKCAVWKDRIIIVGFTLDGGYGGGLTFAEAFQNSDGTLRFESLM